MTFDTLLIANRGEIACRIIRAARTLGLRTVVIYSEADVAAPHVVLADQAILIGAAPVADSYLQGERIIATARRAGAGAIHPGYGFLSENADFADAVTAAGLIFIGPPADAIRVMGDKAGAKRAMRAADVPCVPGYEGEDQSDSHLLATANDIGFPLMVKAAAGGGGRGMRLVSDPAALPDALIAARAEALSAFGADVLILERAVVRPRHVEVQVFADTHGTIIHLGERDCSVQRRHQKVLEEAPCPVMTPALRQAMGDAAVAAARAVDYVGAGTVEFLLDEAGDFFFLEMNTRLQVEHPVTEMITGLDLVALQIRVAMGEALPLAQDDVSLTGHAIEARLYAEDPAAGFLPATGDIALWRPASGSGVRVDAGIAERGEVSPYYDAMVAKVIAHGATRDEARRRLVCALEDTALTGPATNRAFLIDALSHPTFIEGSATTTFIAEAWPGGIAPALMPREAVALAAALGLTADRTAACTAAGDVAVGLLGWRSDGATLCRIDLEVNDQRWPLTAEAVGLDWRVFVGEGPPILISLNGNSAKIDGVSANAHWHAAADGVIALSLGSFDGIFTRVAVGAQGAVAGDGRISAPMPGLLVEWFVEEGAAISSGDPLAVIEAMKMRHIVTATASGFAGSPLAEVGSQLRRGDIILEIVA